MSISTEEQPRPEAPALAYPAHPPIDPRSAEPIRAELLGLERLEAHARHLASEAATAAPRRESSPLLRRFAENGRVLAAAHTRILADARQHEAHGLDAEWLADNFHIVEDVLREVRHDLPPGYDEELPKLATGPLAGYPRVYALALALVAHTDSELEETRLVRFVQAFQEVAPLTIGELWALPTMLRLVLLENLRRLAEQMLWGWDERLRAERWAVSVLSSLKTGARGNPTLPEPTDPFVVRLLQQLRDQGPKAAAILEELESQVEAQGADANEILRREHRRQAANQVSVGNCVISLRLLSAVDWNAFFEQSSQVEAILREDPAGVYILQDFATRDRYRRTVETIARRSQADELDVARRLVERAREGLAHGSARGHVGYYLVDQGRESLQAEFGVRPRWSERLLSWVLRHPRVTYFGPIAGLMLAGLVAVGAFGIALGVSWIAVPFLLAVALLPLSELAVGLVNHVLTLLIPPRVLPKLEFKEGIPAEHATFVVMPTLLTKPGAAAGLLERLEIHYLANPDPHFRFALLTDFADAPQEQMPQDEEVLRDALDRVRELNRRYAPRGPNKFFLFHRRRLWNPSQGCWMGWERKRGKLSEFNQLLRGASDTSYSVLSGGPTAPPRVRFVITLDSDTQMPRDTARRLVGALAHPLNAPRFDPKLGRVIEGHGVLQPRVSFHMTAATHSRFAGLLAASGGIDPYSTAASDTYMDLFGVGSFTGKGIYELDAFEAATGHTFPENHILSHDLIEGNYARCGLLSDTELFDDFPARYHAYARREHRWVRGDWQLLPWLGSKVPTPEGERPNPLPTLERWKLLDNLRRSLIPPALVLLLTLGWTVLPGPPWVWTALALAVPLLPLAQWILGSILGAVRSGSLGSLKRWRDTLPPLLGQALLEITFLADRARITLDAIVRTLARLFRSRQKLLEWETAAATEQRLGTGLGPFFRSMWPSPALAAVLAALVALVRPAALPAAGPVLAAWLVAPLIAFWVSQPKRVREAVLSQDDRRALRRVARRTWLFFETFVGDEDHWLPPDNFQEEPDGRIAHRTSPTNMGLLLLSTLTAHDLGYLTLRGLIERLSRSLDTLEGLERHWGHFYNWYDTRTLKPLPPAYISTVDSGNMLGCLLTLRQGLREKAEAPLFDPSFGEGLIDPLGLAAEAIRTLPAPDSPAAVEARQELQKDLETLFRLLEEAPGDLLGLDDWLGRLDWATVGLLGRLKAAGAGSAATEEPELWLRRISALIQNRRAELAVLAPWLAPLRAWQERAATASGRVPAESADRWEAIRSILVNPPSLVALAGRAGGLAAELDTLAASRPETGDLHAVAEALRSSSATDLVVRLRQLADRAEDLGSVMDFRPLYRPERHLYTIGCNLAQGRLDGACYDLLASEACLTSFLTVARGDAPRRHWFQLSRPFIRAGGRLGLLSWGGTMFEYLMPRLLIRSLPGTTVAEACRTAVTRQIEYGRLQGVPWGISESAFSAQYADGDYQYQAFGVPGLGLKRGLERDLVVAPYATALASMIAPREALENLRRLTTEGAEGPYGYYEAIDYTRDRVPKGRRSVVIRSYMAHHQGMSLVALANAVLDEIMPRRFHTEPRVRAAELLLQERIPRDATIVNPSEVLAATAEGATSSDVTEGSAPPQLSRRINTPDTPAPRTHLLSNLHYHVMITNAGSGWSTCHGLDISRWREDPTCDPWGQFFYVRDVESGLTWSAGHQPLNRPAEAYEVVFSSDKAAFRRLDDGVETLMEVTVSPERMSEVRRLTLTNHGDRPRLLELTSYVEVVLAPRAADRAHPAFAKLFLETEWLPGPGALLCRRRPRSPAEKPIWALHVAAVDVMAPGGKAIGEIQYETDRVRFLGRGRTPADPAALDPGATLSGTTGPVLDPIASLRLTLRVEPGGSAIVAFSTALAESRAEALDLTDRYREYSAAARAFELAWAHSQVEHRHRNWSPEEAHLFQRLASPLIFAGSALRATPAMIAANRQGQSALWRHGISGDLPILLARFSDLEELALARQLLLAHSYLRLKGLEVDLVLLNDESTTYFEELQRQLLESVRAAGVADQVDRPGGIFIRKSAQMSEEDRILLQATARVVLVGDRGPLSAQQDRIERLTPLPGPLRGQGLPHSGPVGGENSLPTTLAFANGFGGFSPDGREYVIVVRESSQVAVGRNGRPRPESPLRPVLPPAPWINVVANPTVGFLVSETGSGATWVGNSQGNRLTPWTNDPVTDPPGEVLYLRDEETGEVWTPTPMPISTVGPVVVRHGWGYTTFERTAQNLDHELTLCVPLNDPVKLIRLRVRNLGEEARRLTATYYAEWVLGTTREATAPHLVTEFDPEAEALLARNSFRMDYSSRVAFVASDHRPRSVTGDRREFLGRHGSLAAPAALGRLGLSDHVGGGLDPCGALQVGLDLEPGEETEVLFLLGEAEDLEAVRALLRRYREPGHFETTLAEVRARWEAALGTVQVQTPDPAFDLLLNGWLLYQVLSCRVWARSAFYQSGGAFGFRDQLQDSMALVHGAPAEARGHILRAAGRQFAEGDVQHWWHPPTGRGVRTRISDDALWLPFVVAHYVEATGDESVLDERLPFLEAPPLKPGQEDDYGLPITTPESATVFEHAARALDHALPVGEHGLPLMGSGDWNDGMNRVGPEGHGESVWLAWFLIACLDRFAPLAEARGESERAALYRRHATELRAAVEKHAWDGDWYLRAFFDNGTPLGTARGEECRIDSIAQSWAAISGAGDPDRVRRAMAAVEDHLVQSAEGLILLFAPPFDQGVLEPGYIKGYLPGIRENGGQYTHAATWVVLATALQGRGQRAAELFSLLNPIRHGADPDSVARYRVEPYVVAGDVYGRPPHVGRGGWSWYTGAAAWLYRVGLEALLGFRRQGETLTVDPCLPGHWPGFEITYHHRSSTYRISVENPNGQERGVLSVSLDGAPLPSTSIPLVDDGQDHEVRVRLGSE